MTDDLLFLESPAHLAMADTIDIPEKDRQWKPYPHLKLINKELLDLTAGLCNRLMINLPAQHGKSLLASIYFPAWLLLVYPEIRILLVGYNEEFATNQFGAAVKKVVEKWGKHSALNVGISKDTSSKGFWRTTAHGRSLGYMKCSGFGGAVAGIAADYFILDDLVKGEEQARLPDELEKLWSFCQATVTNRLRATSKLLYIGTRWSRYDPPGQYLRMAKVTGEAWRTVIFPALAEENDILGRKPGEALCPELKSQKELEQERVESKWFAACRQQHPIEDAGVHFNPGKWPVWTDLGDAVSIPKGIGRQIFMKSDITSMVTVDWAASDKKHSDYTAIGVFGLTPDGQLLIFEVVNQRTRTEECVPLLDDVCRRWRPLHVGVEAIGFQGALADECRRFPNIPEPRRMKNGNQSKLSRARYAMTLGQNGRIYFPDENYQRTLKFEKMHARTWIEVTLDQLQGFTGDGHERDDIVDVFGYAGQMANDMRSCGVMSSAPLLIHAGREDVFGR